MTEPSLPAKPAVDGPEWWERAICYLIIAWSAAFALVPSLRRFQRANFIAGALFIGWGVRRLMRDNRNELLRMSPAQLYQAARSGRRLRSDLLETATIAAFCLTTAVQMCAAWP